MTLNRIVLPLLFVGAAIAGAVTTGCNNGNTTLATPTPSPVPTCAGCTPVPTATPSGPTPTPSPTPAAYQPLANNDHWGYACNAGATASKSVATGQVINGVQTLADTLTLSTLPTTVTAYEANDGLGNTLIYGWLVGNAMTTLGTPAVEYGVTTGNNTMGAFTTYAGPVTGTITTTNEGSVGTKDGYTNVVFFKSVNSAPIYAALGEIDFYTQLGTGPIELDFPDNVPALTCPITGPPTLFSKVRQQ